MRSPSIARWRKIRASENSTNRGMKMLLENKYAVIFSIYRVFQAFLEGGEPQGT
jgi:hypothetical protein